MRPRNEVQKLNSECAAASSRSLLGPLDLLRSMIDYCARGVGVRNFDDSLRPVTTLPPCLGRSAFFPKTRDWLNTIIESKYAASRMINPATLRFELGIIYPSNTSQPSQPACKSQSFVLEPRPTALCFLVQTEPST